ncbi:hypothetical protein R3I93_022646 [Phoxinus phoxinus]|uniref:Uncharacterized protein n=1 Tax=Phoxinus phoxinus TaxID=58324 RepID=A0AAN9C5M5_9TELE
MEKVLNKNQFSVPKPIKQTEQRVCYRRSVLTFEGISSSTPVDLLVGWTRKVRVDPTEPAAIGLDRLH